MNDARNIIEVSSLTKLYSNGVDVAALKDVTFSIQEGEFMGIVGKSGSGKSTLLNMLGTLDVPTSGQIIFNGQDIIQLSGNQLADFRRANIGFVFQMFHLIPEFTVLENIVMPLVPYKKTIDFDITERAMTLCQYIGLDQRVSHLPGQLSGGEQQRVAIARALINYPRVILADEPTGNLDTANGEEIYSLFERLNQEQDVTVVLVTHDNSIAGKLDRVLRLHDGMIES